MREKPEDLRELRGGSAGRSFSRAQSTFSCARYTVASPKFFSHEREGASQPRGTRRPSQVRNRTREKSFLTRERHAALRVLEDALTGVRIRNFERRGGIPSIISRLTDTPNSRE